jgi:hypothetical protein
MTQQDNAFVRGFRATARIAGYVCGVALFPIVFPVSVMVYFILALKKHKHRA